MNKERFIFKRIIKKYACGQRDFSQCWKKVIYKAPIDILKQLATAVIKFSKWGHIERQQGIRKKIQWSPLHIAAEQGHIQLVKHVHGRIFNKDPSDVRSPLHLVAKNRDLDVCQFLINKATDLSPRGFMKETPLHLAAEEGHLGFFQLLFDKLNNKFPLDCLEMTPYHKAAMYGQLEICKFIFANTPDKNPANRLGITPLHEAAETGQLEVCKFFMKNINDKNPRDNIVGNTPLHYATKSGNYVDVSRILCNNVDGQKPLNNRGETPDDLLLKLKMAKEAEDQYAWMMRGRLHMPFNGMKDYIGGPPAPWHSMNPTTNKQTAWMMMGNEPTNHLSNMNPMLPLRSSMDKVEELTGIPPSGRKMGNKSVYILPRLSEISMKDWTTKVKPVLTPHF